MLHIRVKKLKEQTRMEKKSSRSLFETHRARGRVAFKLYACSVFVGVCLIWVYRATQLLTGTEGRWILCGMFAAELWFGFYWVLTLSSRWNPSYRQVFKERLAQRYGENDLPRVDVFVCTADPIIEPPILVINTVLSVMAFDYPREKLSIYLSDDGGSELTFYALLEACHFASSWIPFCKKFKVEPRAPAEYFKQMSKQSNVMKTKDLMEIKHLYNEMENRINAAANVRKIPDNLRQQHKGFSEWDGPITSRDHQAIVQILVDGRNQRTSDNEGFTLPTLVYMAREKRPYRHHNFKAGAMNSLIRVSEEISNGDIILNVDCDMYSNNSEILRDVLCFFMDEVRGQEFAFVQLPQVFNNITKHDIYGNSLILYTEVEFHGFDGYEGMLYIGSGCFHRRKTLCGLKYSDASLNAGERRNLEATSSSLEKKAKDLITSTYEDNTGWGKEVGLKYGCPVEDVISGLSIQCRGWKSIYYNPERTGFLGVAPATLAGTLFQHKRWCEGNFLIFISKYCPFIYGRGKIKRGLQMAYSVYGLWAPCCIPVLYYVSVPSLCLVSSLSLFPNVSNLWFISFAYVITATVIYNIGETLWAGLTLKVWWNEQRMWLFRRLAAYPFGFVDTILKQIGVTKLSFMVTAKVSDDEVTERYEKEMMEFGSSTPMFTIIATFAMLNLLCLLYGLKRMLLSGGRMEAESMLLQFVICASVVLINIPVYLAMFLRSDRGRMPTSTTVTSVSLALLVLLMLLF